LAIANTLSACLNLGLLVYALRKRLSRLGLEGVKQTLIVLVPNAVLAGVIAWLLFRLWEHDFGHARLWARIGGVFVPGGVACVVYWLIALLAKVPAAHDIFAQVGRLFRKAS
jgi:peptidoglycan biosynthesis protein MviN/MurJ (putative lipid II flippase)